MAVSGKPLNISVNWIIPLLLRILYRSGLNFPPYPGRSPLQGTNDEGLMEEVRFHDPVLALDGKENGLYFYEKITEQAGTYLKPGGWLMYEIGCDQGMDVSEIMKKNGFEQIEIKKDLAGLDRVVTGRKMQEEQNV